MSADVVALCVEQPDVSVIVEGLLAAGPDLRVDVQGAGAVVALYDDSGALRLSVEGPRLVLVGGEASRVLAADPTVTTPIWWVEAHEPERDAAQGALGRRFAASMVARCGGVVWPETELASQPLLPASGAALTASLDAVTDRVGIVVQHRELVTLTTWLAEAVAACASQQLGFQLVTSDQSRISAPVEFIVGTAQARWVVAVDGSRYVDGLDGTDLRWTESGFVPSDEQRPVRVGSRPGGSIVIDAVVSHRAADTTEIGRVAEDCFELLTGGPPRGWGVAEPVTQPWGRRQLTELCRSRAPEPTWVVVVGGDEGRPAIGIIEVRREASGIIERVRMSVGSGAATDVDLDPVERLARRLAERHRVRMLVAGLRPGGGDTTVAAGAATPTIPYGLLVGADAIREYGMPLEGSPLQALAHEIGPTPQRTCWLRLTDAFPATSDIDDPDRPLALMQLALRHFGLPQL